MGKTMNFQEHFYSRLASLAARDTREFPAEVLPESYYPAAVLLAFWPVADGTVKVVFTRRTETLPTHRGQMSFPGGRLQEEDASLENTALREAREELGIAPEAVRIMGRLDDAWSAFGHRVVPVVGWLERQPVFEPDPGEVAEVVIADVQTLLRPETSCTHEVVHNGLRHSTHAFNWDGGYVWGMTADILLELFLWINGSPSNRCDIRLANLQRFMNRQQAAGPVSK